MSEKLWGISIESIGRTETILQLKILVGVVGDFLLGIIMSTLKFPNLNSTLPFSL